MFVENFLRVYGDEGYRRPRYKNIVSGIDALMVSLPLAYELLQQLANASYYERHKLPQALEHLEIALLISQRRLPYHSKTGDNYCPIDYHPMSGKQVESEIRVGLDKGDPYPAHWKFDPWTGESLV